LHRICAALGCTPFFVRDQFEPDALTQHFLESLV
jgi:hypothetical protein